MKTVFFSLIILATIGLLTIITNNVYGIQYLNYSSAKYGIQFQYPSDWAVDEKTGRLDEGADIAVDSPTISDGFIIIESVNATGGSGLAFKSHVYSLFKSAVTDYTKELAVIEKPSFMTIDNQQAGTYLLTNKDKYDESASKWADQTWIVTMPHHGYVITLASVVDVFDSPITTEIRNHFIKSIKFLSNDTNVSVSSRFT
jgi:hypothetical protein